MTFASDGGRIGVGKLNRTQIVFSCWCFRFAAHIDDFEEKNSSTAQHGWQKFEYLSSRTGFGRKGQEQISQNWITYFAMIKLDMGHVGRKAHLLREWLQVAFDWIVMFITLNQKPNIK